MSSFLRRLRSELRRVACADRHGAELLPLSGRPGRLRAGRAECPADADPRGYRPGVPGTSLSRAGVEWT